MKKEFDLESMESLPPLAVSFLDTLSIKTGTWRYLRPFFQQKTAPCHEACPAGEDVVGWIHLLKEGKLEQAYHLIRQENPFPGVCGRVCVHPCENACNQVNLDQAIPIHILERFLADFGIQCCNPPSRVSNRKKEKVMIIGAGPSGLSCAYYLAIMGYGVTVYEASTHPGGVLRTGIPEYRLPKHVLDHEIGLIEALGVKIENGVEIGKTFRIGDVQGFDAVYIAPGAPISSRLDIPGEDLQSVISGLDLLRSINLGRRQRIEGDVAIIGGGNTAIDAARSVLRMGGKPLILYRRSREEMPAIKDEVKEAESEGIEILYQVSPAKVLGERGKVRALECVRMRLEESNSSGRRQPVPIEGSNFTIEVNLVITAIGEVTDLRFLGVDFQIQDQLIVTDSYTSTNKRGFFSGGDATFHPRTVVHAIGSGKLGAIAIDQFCRGGEIKGVEALIKIGETGTFSMNRYLEGHAVDKRAQEVVHFESLNMDYFEKMDPVVRKKKPPEEAAKDFREVNQGLTEDISRELARRCFSCGLCDRCGNCLVFCPDMAISIKDDEYPEINYDYCKGCGICATECPRSVISVEEEKE